MACRLALTQEAQRAGAATNANGCPLRRSPYQSTHQTTANSCAIRMQSTLLMPHHKERPAPCMTIANSYLKTTVPVIVVSVASQ
jgi:hypothetical protein